MAQRELSAQRTRDALQAAKARGKKLGHRLRLLAFPMRTAVLGTQHATTTARPRPRFRYDPLARDMAFPRAPARMLRVHACKLGCEGIVSKRKGSPYRSGRTPDWIKTFVSASAAIAAEGQAAVTPLSLAMFESIRSSRPESIRHQVEKAEPTGQMQVGT